MLLQRVHSLGDARSVELITDALSWAMVNFDELGYNCKTNKEKLQIMPNMIGFQSVLPGSALVWGHRTGKQISLLTSSHSSTPPSGS